jgi:hypothetical protein
MLILELIVKAIVAIIIRLRSESAIAGLEV